MGKRCCYQAPLLEGDYGRAVCFDPIPSPHSNPPRQTCLLTPPSPTNRAAAYTTTRRHHPTPLVTQGSQSQPAG